jgi:glycine/D-amino acid oxidase-like deaminating enzyme
MNSKKYNLDTIIIGQGLAGSLLAWRLIQLGQKILVIDNGKQSASRMAAGLVNPVTGQRMVKTKNADDYLPAAREFYHELEQIFDKSFFHSIDMVRFFRSSQEHKTWEKRKADPAYKAYLADQIEPDHFQDINNPYGSFKQLQTGYLDTVTLLDCLRDFFRDNNSYLKKDINYREIRISPDEVRVNNILTKQLIFCEGYKATENPWFSWLPFKPAKGEILTLQTDHPLPKYILNTGKWLLPLPGGKLKFGSTYQWDQLNSDATDKARQELMDSVNNLFREQVMFDVINHQAGIRPCTRDTLPYLGTHPKEPRLGIFNGFGSKGSLMIPFHSLVFSEYLLDKNTIQPESDIKRYWQSDE